MRMYRNAHMKERLKRLDKAALEQPKVSLEEALRQYDEHEKLAVLAGLMVNAEEPNDEIV